MHTIPKHETVTEINTIINNLIEANERITYIGKHSPDIYQSRVYQYITTNEATIQYLQTLKNSLLES